MADSFRELTALLYCRIMLVRDDQLDFADLKRPFHSHLPLATTWNDPAACVSWRTINQSTHLSINVFVLPAQSVANSSRV